MAVVASQGQYDQKPQPNFLAASPSVRRNGLRIETQRALKGKSICQTLRVATAGGTDAARRAGSIAASDDSTQRVAIPAGRNRQSSRGSSKETSSQ